MKSQEVGENLVTRLREAIIEGAFSPGQHLSEVVVSKEFNVSRNTLREAFRALEQRGLLIRTPHRGVFVLSPTTTGVLDLFRVRRIIEGGVIASASPLHPSVDDMKAAVVTARAALKEKDWKTVGSANMRYHAALVNLADSPRLSFMYQHTAAELRLAFMKIDNPEFLHRPFVAKNKELVDIFVSKGASAAAAYLAAYLDEAEKLVLAAYSRLGIR